MMKAILRLPLCSLSLRHVFALNQGNQGKWVRTKNMYFWQAVFDLHSLHAEHSTAYHWSRNNDSYCLSCILCFTNLNKIGTWHDSNSIIVRTLYKKCSIISWKRKIWKLQRREGKWHFNVGTIILAFFFLQLFL